MLFTKTWSPALTLLLTALAMQLSGCWDSESCSSPTSMGLDSSSDVTDVADGETTDGPVNSHGLLILTELSLAPPADGHFWVEVFNPTEQAQPLGDFCVELGRLTDQDSWSRQYECLWGEDGSTAADDLQSGDHAVLFWGDGGEFTTGPDSPFVHVGAAGTVVGIDWSEVGLINPRPPKERPTEIGAEDPQVIDRVYLGTTSSYSFPQGKTLALGSPDGRSYLDNDYRENWRTVPYFENTAAEFTTVSLTCGCPDCLACSTHLSAGEGVLFSELAFASDEQWLEIHNASPIGYSTLDMCYVEAPRAPDEPPRSSERLTDLALTAGGFAVLRDSDPAWGALGRLAVADGTIVLVCAGAVVDTVTYDDEDGYYQGDSEADPRVPGCIRSLSPSVATADGNDDPERWCPACDDGTPGDENPACPCYPENPCEPQAAACTPDGLGIIPARTNLRCDSSWGLALEDRCTTPEAIACAEVFGEEPYCAGDRRTLVHFEPFCDDDHERVGAFCRLGEAIREDCLVDVFGATCVDEDSVTVQLGTECRDGRCILEPVETAETVDCLSPGVCVVPTDAPGEARCDNWPNIGDVIFTEIMFDTNPVDGPDGDDEGDEPDPVGILEEEGEWIEFLNTTGQELRLGRCHLRYRDDGAVKLSDDLVFAPHERKVISRTSDRTRLDPIPTNNFAPIWLANEGAVLQLVCGGQLIDRVRYDGLGDSAAPFRGSIFLHPDYEDHISNDDSEYWLLSTPENSCPYYAYLGSVLAPSTCENTQHYGTPWEPNEKLVPCPIEFECPTEE